MILNMALRHIRILSNLHQADIALLTGVSQATISMLEANEMYRNHLRPATLQRILQVYSSLQEELYGPPGSGFVRDQSGATHV